MSPRIIGLAGLSGAGKTHLLVRLLPELRSRGLSVSTVKHAHHDFDVDQPGKDSHRHRVAGAREVLVASARRFALMHEHGDDPEPDLAGLLVRLAAVDLVLVEGFKREDHPKIEVYRAALGQPPLHGTLPNIVAFAGDVEGPTGLPAASLDDIPAVADLVLAHSRPWPVRR